jgi:hypothetical protein
VSIALTLLEDVRWRGKPVAGDRPQALLAALAARGCRPVRAEDLSGLARHAAAVLDQDAAAAARLAREALALTGGLPEAGAAPAGHLRLRDRRRDPRGRRRRPRR